MITAATRALNVESARGTPGAFWFDKDGYGLRYICPCGCGDESFLAFRGQVVPPHPTWEWDGNIDAPTLRPSILRTGGCRWHGYLQNGQWVPVPDGRRTS